MTLGELKEYAKVKAFDTVANGEGGEKYYCILMEPFSMKEQDIRNILNKMSNNHMYGDTMKNWEELGKLAKAFDKCNIIPDDAVVTYEVLRKSDSLDSYRRFAVAWGKKKVAMLVNMTGCGKYALFDVDERRDLPIIQDRSLGGIIKKLDNYELLHV